MLLCEVRSVKTWRLDPCDLWAKSDLQKVVITAKQRIMQACISFACIYMYTSCYYHKLVCVFFVRVNVFARLYMQCVYTCKKQCIDM